MDTKYSPLDHGGLETVERNDGLEVVPDSHYGPDRKSTLFNPEAVEAQYHSKEEHGNYYLGGNGSDSAQAPYSAYSDTKPTYFNSDNGGAGKYTQPGQRQKEGRRYCGMRKAIFIAVLVVVILLVVVGAVLGGVLGVLLPKKNAG